jgi:hypothetical protein
MTEKGDSEYFDCCYSSDDDEDNISIVSVGSFNDTNKENDESLTKTTTHSIKKAADNSNNHSKNSIINASTKEFFKLKNNRDILPAPPGLVNAQVQQICDHNNLPSHFKNREEMLYMVCFSQCIKTRQFTVPRSDEKSMHMQCASAPNCNFHIKASNTKQFGWVIREEDGVHTCEINEHWIQHDLNTTGLASCSAFLARFLKPYLRQGTCGESLCKHIILQELKCNVPRTTVWSGNNSWN